MQYGPDISKTKDKKYIDPSTNRKKDIVKNKLVLKENFPVFSIVEFNIYGSCNRNCSFCPVSIPEIYTKVNEGISLDLFSKAMDDLKKINYQGKILFSAFSEPMLHKDIYKLLSIAKEKNPHCILEMVSNGDLLKKDERFENLFESGLDTISLSLYDGPEQMDYFNGVKERLGFTDRQIILRRRYLENGNYGMTISNRSGLIDSDKYRDENEKIDTALPREKNCFYPFYMLLVDYNGDVLLCPHDWEKKFVAGNLLKDDLWEVWKGSKYQTARNKLSKCDRKFQPCVNCDVAGDLMGEENFNAWSISMEASKSET